MTARGRSPEPVGHDEWSELVVGRALDALEPGDDARLDEHLPGCASCSELLADMTHVAASLAYGADDCEPPAELLDRIRAALPPPSVGAAPASLDQARTRRAQRRGWTRPRVLTALGAVSAAAALAVLGGYAVHVQDQRDHAQTALAADAVVVHDLQAGHSYAVSLTSDGPASGAAVVAGRTVDLVTRGLDQNDTASSLYVLWGASAPGQPMRAITGFDVTAGGVRVVHATMPSTLQHPTVFGVTEEKGRTLPTIPGNVVLGVAPTG